MYYKLKYYTIFRNYGEIGYLIYQKCPFDIDRVVNNIGAVFLDELSYNPKSIEVIVKSIIKKFIDVTYEIIYNDVVGFYDGLVKEGFLDKAETLNECLQLNDTFSYSQNQVEQLKSVVYDNMENRESTQEYLEKFFSSSPKLLKFQVEITNVCNERCVHCYIPHKFKVFHMPEEIFFKTLKESYKLGVVSFGISGGEPMSHPSFKKFVMAAKEYDMTITILTNLTLLDDECINIFKNSRVNVLVSLYSINEKNHDYITQLPGSCKRTKNAIQKLIDNNIPVTINCPLMKENKDDFIELSHWAKANNLLVKTDYCIMARCDRSTDNLKNRISIEDMERITYETIDENEMFKSLISAEDYEEQCKRIISGDDKKWCGVGVTCCSMSAHGNVIPCPSWEDYFCGNIADKSLEKIWNEAEKFKYLRTLSRKNFKKCTDCEDKAFCSLCMARNANESATKDPLEVLDYFCEITHINRKNIERWRKEHLNL